MSRNPGTSSMINGFGLITLMICSSYTIHSRSLPTKSCALEICWQGVENAIIWKPLNNGHIMLFPTSQVRILVSGTMYEYGFVCAMSVNVDRKQTDATSHTQARRHTSRAPTEHLSRRETGWVAKEILTKCPIAVNIAIFVHPINGDNWASTCGHNPINDLDNVIWFDADCMLRPEPKSICNAYMPPSQHCYRFF
jgi:hypothetical protein